MTPFDQGLLRVVHRHQTEVRDEIVRHRMAATPQADRTHTLLPLRAWRKALGQIVIELGRAIEGEKRIETPRLPTLH